MLKKFMKYYQPHKKMFYATLIAAVFIAIVDLLIPNLTSIIINDAILKSNYDVFYKISLTMIILYILKILFTYFVSFYGHMVGVSIEFKMRKNLFEKITSLPIKFFDNNTVGRLMARITNDLNEISEVAHHGPEDLIKMIFLLIGSAFLMIRMNVVLACIIIVLVPTIIFINIYAQKRFFNTSMDMKLKIADINSQINDTFGGIRQVKAYTNEGYELDKFEVNNDRFFYSKRRFYKVMAAYFSMLESYFAFLSLTTIVLGSYLVIKQQMNVGQLTAFIMYVNLLQAPIAKFANFITEFNKASTGFVRYLEIMNLKSQPEAQDAIDLVDVKGRIEFKNVYFRYSKETDYILKDFSLVVEPNQTLALVGESGAGKTTICNLINRYYEIEKGQILIDGVDIKDLKTTSLRSNIGLVSQDVFIFGGTLYDNIIYGDLTKTKEEVLQAAKQARLLDLINSLEDGIMSDIGERGVKLSGGQKQRLSLARVFLKNPAMMILDEATSSLDNETERQIQQVLEDLSLDRTNIVVAHRLSTIENAHKIVVVSKNGIEEVGTHQELLAKKSKYYQLYTASLKI